MQYDPTAQSGQNPHILERERTRVKEPHMYGVVFYNDDFTTMEFVVSVLELVFHKTESEAQSLMMAVHRAGSALIGRYTHDIAVTKRDKAMEMARKEGFPLRVEVKEV